MLIRRNLHMKSSKVSIKTRSTPASLSFKGQATKHTTVKWSIVNGVIKNEGFSKEWRYQTLNYFKHRLGLVKLPHVILLPEKFLPFDWLRAEVFQLNLKYLHVKITVTVVTQNHQIISSHEISRCWNQEIQELKENPENQNTEKSTAI